MIRHSVYMKKFISYILVLFMVLSQPCCVFAENENYNDAVSQDVLVEKESVSVDDLSERTDRNDDAVPVSKEAVSDEEVSDEEVSDEEVPEDIVSDEMIGDDSASEESISDETISQDSAEYDLTAQDIESEDSVDEDADDFVAEVQEEPVNEFENDPTVARVYQNTAPGNKGFDTASTIIGYIKLNKEKKTAEYVSATGASASNPLSVSRSIIVPRRVVVSTYNGSLPTYKGKPCVYDYTDSGYDMNSEGYAIDHENGQIIQVKGDDDQMHDLYLGKEYTITSLGEKCFKNEQCKLAQKITIPNTITSDITVDYFSECISCVSISVDKKPEDEGLTEGVNRYVSGRKNGKNNEEVSQLNVLVDQMPNINIDGIGNVENYVIWCPPKFSANTYEIAWEENIAIGPNAFKNCKGLKGVTTASNTPIVFFIGESAFEGCEELIDVGRLTKSEKLKYIGDRAFYGCTSLKNVTFWETSVGGTSLGERVFYDTAITSLEIPYGYHEMNGETFYGMQQLKKFNVKEYDDYENYSFIDIDDCLYRYEDPANKEESKYELVCHPAKKTEPEDTFKLSYKVTRIDPYSITFCNLTKLIFPSTIYELDKDAIKDCTNLRNMYFYSGMPDMTATNSDEMFENCITSIARKLTVYAGYNTKIYKYCEAQGYTMKALYNEDWFEFTDPDADGNVQVTKFTYSKSGDDDILPDVVVPDFIIKDGVKYFVTGIGANVFAEPNITSVMFLYHMKDIDANAFRIVPDESDSSKDINADSLEEIIVEDGNEFLTTEDGVLYAKELKKNSKTEYVITNLLYYPVANSLTSYTTKDSLVSLPENAFRGASNLRYINIYDSILTIGKQDDGKTNEPAAFAGCKNLVKINIIHKEGVKDEDITYASDDGVLYEYDRGTYIRLLYYPKARRIMDGDNSSAIAYNVVRGCKEIVDMKDCQYLMSVTFPNTVQIIDDDALSNCTALSTVVFEKGDADNTGIQTIGENAFRSARIRSLYIPGSIKKIDYGAFYLNPQLEEVNIEGDHLTYVGMRCFYNNPSLKTVLISGTQKNETGDMVTLDTEAFAECIQLTSFSVTNMETVTIEDSCLVGDTALKEVSFYSSVVDKIGENAFEGDSCIETIDLGQSNLLKEIGNEAFLDCSSLNEIILPTSIEKLNDRVFKNCNKLMYINISDLENLETVGKECFYGCFFTKAVFSKRIKSIGDGAFENNPMLCCMYIPESLTGDFTTGNPFKGYGKELFVYGVAGSPVETFINSLGENGPTFIAGDIPYALVTVDPSAKTLFDKGDTTTTITAYVTSDESIDTNVKWVCDNNDVALLEVLGGSDGTYQAKVSAKMHGVAKVYAINRATGEMACATITFKEAMIELSPSPSAESKINYKKGGNNCLIYNLKMNTKGTYKTIDLNGSSNPPRQVYYHSDNNAVAKVDGKGRVVAKREGVVTITCYAGKKENNTYAETIANITVYKPYIKMNQRKVSLNAQQSGFDVTNNKATITVTHEGASNDVEWTTSNKNVVEFVDNSKTNNSAVVYGKRAGSAVITATCNGIKTSCKVTVLPTSLTLNKSSLTLYSGGSKTDSFTLTAKVKGVDKKVIWTSDREDCAVVSTKGVVSAIAPGKDFYVRASANGMVKTCRITVLDSTVSIYEVGGTEPISQIQIDSKGTNKKKALSARVVGRNKKLTWKTTDKDCASVSKQGVVTGKSGGVVQLYATANGVDAMIDVYVADTRIELDEAKRTLYMDPSMGASDTILHADICGTDKNRTIEWTVPEQYRDVVKLQKIGQTGASEFDELTTNNKGKKTEWIDGYNGEGEVKLIAKKKGKAKVTVTANGISQNYTIVVE